MPFNDNDKIDYARVSALLFSDIHLDHIAHQPYKKLFTMKKKVTTTERNDTCTTRWKCLKCDHHLPGFCVIVKRNGEIISILCKQLSVTFYLLFGIRIFDIFLSFFNASFFFRDTTLIAFDLKLTKQKLKKFQAIKECQMFYSKLYTVHHVYTEYPHNPQNLPLL